MMYAHECDLMCMCKVQYHMPPVCLELLITTVSLWICSIQEVVPPETMLQTVYPKSLQMQRSKLNICVGNKPLQNPTFAFSFFFSCSKKKGVTKSIQEHQRLGVVSSSQPLLLWHLVIITAWVWRQRSCTACERFCYRFFSCKTDCEDGGKTKDNHKSVKSMERRKWNFASCSLRGGPNQLIATKDISPTWSALYVILYLLNLLTIENQKKLNEQHLAWYCCETSLRIRHSSSSELSSSSQPPPKKSSRTLQFYGKKMLEPLLFSNTHGKY